MKFLISLFLFAALLATVSPAVCPLVDGYDNTIRFPETVTAVTGYFPAVLVGGRYCATGYSTADGNAPRRQCSSANNNWTNQMQNRCFKIPNCATETLNGWVYTSVVPGVTKFGTCALGYTCNGSIKRSCVNTQNLQSDWSDPVVVDAPGIATRNTCPAIDGWPLTQSLTNGVTIPCDASVAVGTQSRDCGATDWGTVNTSLCIPKCFGAPWPLTNPGVTAETDCPEGSTGTQTRLCSASGVWGAPDTSGCISQCPADAPWPFTDRSTTATMECDPEYFGNMTRACDAAGNWEPVDEDDCVLKCPAENGWPQTNPSAVATINCAAGLIGLQTRTCGASGGTWGNADTSACKCAATGDWAETDLGQTATANCPQFFTGTQTRLCGPAGFETPDTSSCISASCAAEGDWPETLSTTTANLACSPGLYGTQSRACLNGGVWDDVVDACYPACPAQGPWPSTIPEVTETLPCNPGFTGDQTRKCDLFGNWFPVDVSDCVFVPGSCPSGVYDHTTWPSHQLLTPDTVLIEGECEERYRSVSTPKRPCTVTGWSNKTVDRCLTINCSPDTTETTTGPVNWPRTQAYKKANDLCPVTGQKISRICEPDGTWLPPVGNCDFLE